MGMQEYVEEPGAKFCKAVDIYDERFLNYVFISSFGPFIQPSLRNSL